MAANSKQRVGGPGAPRLRGETAMCPPARLAFAGRVAGKSGKTEQLTRPLCLIHWGCGR